MLKKRPVLVQIFSEELDIDSKCGGKKRLLNNAFKDPVCYLSQIVQECVFAD